MSVRPEERQLLFGPNFPRRIRNKQSEVCVNLKAASRSDRPIKITCNGSKSKKGAHVAEDAGESETALNMFAFYFADNKSADSCNVYVINWRTHIWIDIRREHLFSVLINKSLKAVTDRTFCLLPRTAREYSKHAKF